MITVHPNSLGLFHTSKRSKYSDKIVGWQADDKNFVQIVPPAGRLRLSPDVLAAAGLTGVELDFNQFTDKIVVSKKVPAKV